MNARALLVLGALLLSACRVAVPTPLVSPTIPLPPIFWVSEMQSYDEDFSRTAMLSNSEIESFQSEWQSIRNSVASQVSVDALVNISGWAKEQTKNTILPANWITNLSMSSIGATKDGKRALFSQSVEQGVPLPVHAPIVFRRLMVGAVYDRDARSIAKIYITIRGWREE